jgi:4-diphosphocytidyl-2-C-methyl-D-erythritol kinase
MPPPFRVRIRAPAKINLTLRVVGRRPDGYHDLVSWVAPIDLCDELVIERSDAPGAALTCDAPVLPTDDRNLVLRAAEALRRAAVSPRDRAGTGRTPPAFGALITLKKRIPIGAGLGGGSSDAAAALRGLSRVWGLDWPAERLMAVGAALGSDVPLFVAGRQCVIRGRGERVTMVDRPWRGWIALALPSFSVSTAAVYAAHSSAGGIPGETPMQPVEGDADEPARLAALPAREFRRLLYNDLEPAARRVEARVGALHARLDGLGGVPVRMTGSGGGLFAVFDDQGEAEAWGRAAAERAGEAVQVVVCCTWHWESETAEGE